MAAGKGVSGAGAGSNVKSASSPEGTSQVAKPPLAKRQQAVQYLNDRTLNQLRHDGGNKPAKYADLPADVQAQVRWDREAGESLGRNHEEFVSVKLPSGDQAYALMYRGQNGANGQ